jgi:hypothetical protein
MEPFKYASKNVVIGKDSFLFLFNGGHNVHDYHTRTRVPSPESINAVTTNFSSRKEYCKNKDIHFLHVLFPNKQAALPSLYPVEISSVSEQFLSSHDYGDELLSMDPFLEALGKEAWLKTDTHLNQKGFALSAVRIAEILLKEDLKQYFEALTQRSFVRARRGDLSIMLGDDGINESEEEVLYQLHWNQYQFNNSLAGGNNGLIDILINGNAIKDARLLMFGDSFGRCCASFLSYFFTHVFFCRTPFLHDEIADAYKPDYIVTQSIERYLPSTTLDDERPIFLLYPTLGKAGKAFEGDRAFFEALNGELSYPRKPYHLFMDSLLNE